MWLCRIIGQYYSKFLCLDLLYESEAPKVKFLNLPGKLSLSSAFVKFNCDVSIPIVSVYNIWYETCMSLNMYKQILNIS